MRVTVRKSAADEVCRWWGLPLFQKSNPYHDARGRFAAGSRDCARDEQIAAFVEAALQEGGKTHTLVVGKITDAAKARIKAKTGIEGVEQLVIDTSSVRHSLGNARHNLVKEDFLKIADVVNGSDDITLDNKRHADNETGVFFEKSDDKNTALKLVMEFRRKKGNLALVTFYRQKKKRATAPMPARASPKLTSKTVTAHNRSIPQGEQNASDKSLHPRFMVKKSVAKAICKRWGLPEVRKDNPRHDARGCFAAGAGEPVPTDRGDFGDIYECFKGKPNEAVKFLLKKKSGEAVGALHHKDVGDIDLVWGKVGTGDSDGYGLAKLAQFHPEVLGDLQGILDDMSVASRTENRVVLESEKHEASVRLSWNDKSKKWLLTAYKKDGGVSDSTTDIARTESSRKNDTPTLANTTKGSIAQNDKNATEKLVRHPRLVVQKAVVREICKAKAHHDARGRFAAGGEGASQKRLSEYIEAILGGTREQRAALERTYFQMARTPQKLKDIGLTGDSFTVRYGVISRHKGKNASHSLSADEWKALCKRLENADNLVVAKHGEGFSVFLALPDTTMVGVTVKNSGKSVEVNSVSTVYKREIKEAEDIVYPAKGKVSPEQSALLDRQKLSISASSGTLPRTIVPQGKQNTSEKSLHPRFVLQKAVARRVLCAEHWWAGCGGYAKRRAPTTTEEGRHFHAVSGGSYP